MTSSTKRLSVDCSQRAGTVSPLLFGHNLEHTRRVLSRGLCAELLQGRKFTGPVAPPGVAEPWYAVGNQGCHFQVERGFGRWGMQGDPYTRNYDPEANARKAGIRCQTVRSYRRGDRVGIGQGDLFLKKGQRYVGFVAVRSADSPRIDLSIGSRTGRATHFRTVVQPLDEGWDEHEFEFVSPSSDDGARLELTVSVPCVFSVGAVSLRPAETFHGMRTDVVDLLEQISAPILRWPGGNFAGCYRWRDGLLPVHRRAPLPGGGILPSTYGHDDHEIGTDEFMALCRKIGSEPWITINMSLEGPEDAAAWVEYCNGSADTEWGARRSEGGNTDPYGVTYWSLGNEMGYGHMGGPNTPEEYGKCAAECAKAMKEVDSSIVLVASGTWWREEWFSAVLAKHGKWFDHVSHHEYTSLVRDFAGDEGAKEVRRLACSPAGCTLEALEQVQERVKAHAPSGKSIGTSFDEWNVWHTWFGNPGVPEAMHAAAMLNMFSREAQRIGLTIGAYFEPINEGAIRVEQDGAAFTPAGQVFEFFKAHHGNERIQVAAPGAGEALDLAASVDSETGDLVVTAVNRDPVSGTTALITFEGVDSISSVSGDVLASRDFTPGSEFTSRKLNASHVGGGRVKMALPSCAIARLRVSFK